MSQAISCAVAIVGAGPAGSCAALHLASRGVEVALLEKKALPRYKPCGGGLSVKSCRLLPRYPKEVVEDSTTKVVFLYRGGDPLTVPLDQPVMHMVMRDRFDLWLIEQAERSGVSVYTETEVTGIEPSSQGLLLTAGEQLIHARLVIAADGAHGRTSKALGLHFPIHRGLALESELPQPPESLSGYRGKVYIDYGSLKHGYTWIFPKHSHLSVGCGSFYPDGRRLLACLEKFYRVREFEPPQQNELKAYPLPVLNQSPSAWHTELGMVLGDAGGLIDPFSGEGIYYALLSGTWAAEAAWQHLKGSACALEKYSQRIRENILPELRAAKRLGRVIYGFPSLVHTLLKQHPNAAGKLVSVIHGEQTYRGLFDYLSQRFPLFR